MHLLGSVTFVALATVMTIVSGQLTPKWAIGFTRTIFPGGTYQSAYCLEDGEFGNRPDSRDPLNSYQFCSVGQIGSVIPNPSLWVGAIGNVCGAVLDLGTFATIGHTYNTNYGSDETWASIAYNWSDSRPLWTIVSTEYTFSQPINNTDALDTTTSGFTFMPVAGHVYLFRLTDGPVTNNSWSSNLMFGKLFVMTAAANRVDLTWVVLWPQPCASNPCGPDQECMPKYPTGQTPYFQCHAGPPGPNGNDGASGVTRGEAAGIAFGMALVVVTITAIGVFIYHRVRPETTSSFSSSASAPISSAPQAPAASAYQALGSSNAVNYTGQTSS